MTNSDNLKAIIDMGSLKAKLSVFNIQTLDIIYQKSCLTLLGKSISENGIVIEEALNRLNEALIEIKKDKEKRDSHHYSAIGVV